jgi:chorismate synthase
VKQGLVLSESNNAGGILGGISSGMPIIMNVVIKPTPSISKQQQSINMQTLENVEMTVKGRHDVCIVPRAVIVVESMIAIVLCDFALRAGLLRRTIQ